jgi:iron complex transport system substrate-binding protein
VISLIPSATETLMALGATDRVVGRTRYDVAPELAAVASVGGGIGPSVEAIVALRPDLVLAWENDKRREVPNKLAALGVPVFSLRTEDTSDVFRNIANLGRLTARDSAATALAARLRRELDEVRRSVADQPRPRVLYVVFNDPPMTAGPGTFIGQLIGVAGGRLAFDDVRELWPTVAMEEIVRRDPDVVVLPVGEFRSNAVAALRDRAGWRDVPAVRAGRVVTVPADLLSRPGPNLGAAARALRAALHPELAAGDAAPPAPRP